MAQEGFAPTFASWPARKKRTSVGQSLDGIGPSQARNEHYGKFRNGHGVQDGGGRPSQGSSSGGFYPVSWRTRHLDSKRMARSGTTLDCRRVPGNDQVHSDPTGQARFV